jgi:hypothetical protein
MVEAKTHCYGWRQTTKQKLGKNRGIPKTQRVLPSTNIKYAQQHNLRPFAKTKNSHLLTANLYSRKVEGVLPNSAHRKDPSK